jgi:DNA-binding IclR family transcriptional regulator
VSLQTLDRALAALRLLASAREPLRLTDVQKSLAISKPTAHRLLAALIEHTLVEQDAATRLYRLGPGIDLLRSLAPGGAAPDLRSLSMPGVYALAESSGDTVFLMARDRMETVCLARESGSYPIRAITIEVGTRRPLGAGAGGLAILAALDSRESARLVEALAPRLHAFPNTSTAQVLKAVEAARRTGYAFSDEQVVTGVRGVSVCIRNAAGAPIAAVGIAAIRERLRSERVQCLVEQLRTEAFRIESEIAGHAPRADKRKRRA